VEPFAWLLLLMAVAIVAAFFYLKRREQQVSRSRGREVAVRESSYGSPPPHEALSPREDQLP
jgi:hypothetical protein